MNLHKQESKIEKDKYDEEQFRRKKRNRQLTVNHKSLDNSLSSGMGNGETSVSDTSAQYKEESMPLVDIQDSLPKIALVDNVPLSVKDVHLKRNVVLRPKQIPEVSLKIVEQIYRPVKLKKTLVVYESDILPHLWLTEQFEIRLKRSVLKKKPISGTWTMNVTLGSPKQYEYRQSTLVSRVILNNSMFPININLSEQPVINYKSVSLKTQSKLIRGTSLKTGEAVVSGTQRSDFSDGDVSLEYENMDDPLDKIFGIGAGKIRELEPLVILFRDWSDDSYIDTFNELLVRLYREKHGGHPEIKRLSLREDWNKREIEQWLDEGKLFLIDLDSDNKTEIDEKLLADRLWAIFSKKKGIVVFYTRDPKKFERYKELLNGLNWSNLNFKLEIIEIIPLKLTSEEKRELTRLIYGLTVDVPLVETTRYMDSFINIARQEYKKTLYNLIGKYELIGFVNASENESDEHYAGKVFVVDCLIKKLQKEEKLPKTFNKIDWDVVEKEFIKTEQPINDLIIPDVIFVPQNEYYEFETLFGEGFSKIPAKTLNKYHKHTSGARVKIIVEPMTAFLHAKEFSMLIELITRKKRFKGLDIKFYTFDIHNNKLLELEAYLTELYTFLKNIRSKQKEEE